MYARVGEEEKKRERHLLLLLRNIKDEPFPSRVPFVIIIGDVVTYLSSREGRRGGKEERASGISSSSSRRQHHRRTRRRRGEEERDLPHPLRRHRWRRRGANQMLCMGASRYSRFLWLSCRNAATQRLLSRLLLLGLLAQLLTFYDYAVISASYSLVHGRYAAWHQYKGKRNVQKQKKIKNK